MTNILLLTTTQIVVYVFLGIIAVVLSGFAWLLFKSITDHRKYHNTSLPSLEKKTEVVIEDSAFALDSTDDAPSMNSDFELENDDTSLFDFGINIDDEDNGSSAAIFKNEPKKKEKRKLFGKKDSEKSDPADDQSLLDDLPSSPWNSMGSASDNGESIIDRPDFDIEYPDDPDEDDLDYRHTPVAESFHTNGGSSFLPVGGSPVQHEEPLPAEVSYDLPAEDSYGSTGYDESSDYVTPDYEIPEEGEPEPKEEYFEALTPAQEEVEESDEPMLRSFYEDDDSEDYSPITNGGSAFGGKGLQNFELKETPEGAGSEVIVPSKIKIPRPGNGYTPRRKA